MENIGDPFGTALKDLPESLPIFPLPGAMLLPHGRMPLNIFEPRYLDMVLDSLKQSRLIGMVQTEAHRALNSYVAQAQSSGLRCIIVITGKGRVSEGGGVLRNQVPQWLNSPALRPLILAFTPAQPRDGGDGALYVLLRRKR